MPRSSRLRSPGQGGRAISGSPGPNGTVVFDLTFQAKSNGSNVLLLTGTFVHGFPNGRFVYLGWRDAQGGFAQRLKLPLGTITWNDVREALVRQQPLVGNLVDHHPKATSTERTSEDLARSPGRSGGAIMNRSNRTCRAAGRRPPVSGGLLAGTGSSQPRQEAALRQ